jgi:pimeloyl-ACP methyl ester carboxylesterase
MYGLKLLVRSNGVTPNQVARIFQDTHLLRVVRGIFLPIKSSTLRRRGFHLDDAQIRALPIEPGYDISFPTYICHAANDPLAPPSGMARLASSIPGAEYLETPDGGHLFFVVHSGQKDIRT